MKLRLINATNAKVVARKAAGTVCPGSLLSVQNIYSPVSTTTWFSSLLRGPGGGGGGGGHNSPEFFIGVGDSILHQTLTIFQTKICNIPIPFFSSDQVSRIHSCFFKIHSHSQTFIPHRWLKSIPYFRPKRLLNHTLWHRI